MGYDFFKKIIQPFGRKMAAGVDGVKPVGG